MNRTEVEPSVCDVEDCGKPLENDEGNVIVYDDVTQIVCSACLPGALDAGGTLVYASGA